MIRQLILAAIAILALWWPQQYGPAEAQMISPVDAQLVNGGFEQGLTGWQSPTWFSAVVGPADAEQRSGEASLVFQGKAAGPYVRQEIPATPGETIELSGWINVPVRRGAMELLVELVARDGSNRGLGTVLVARVASTTGGWLSVRGSMVLPKGTVAVAVVIRLPQLDGTAYIDDLSIRRSGTTSVTATPSPTPRVASPTSTPTPTRTRVPTPTPTAKPSPTATITPSPTPTSKPSPNPSPTPYAPGGALYGAWVGKSSNMAGNESAFDTAVGKPRAIRHWFWSAAPVSLSAANFTRWSSTTPDGAILMLSWAPSPYNSSLASINTGKHDSYIVDWARALKSYGRDVWLRLMWEDNGRWYWWTSGADWETAKKEQYKLAFRRVVEIFRREGASRVRFVWSPNVSGNGVAEPLPSYPGATYVDWIGLVGYPFRSGKTDFYSTYRADYQSLSNLGKPMAITEIGFSIYPDSERARQVTNLLEYELPFRFPRFTGLVWFSEPGWDDLLNPNYPLTLAAFRRGINGPYYRGR